MQRKVSLAVVGCGYWGSKHVRIASQSPNIEARLAVDPSDDCLEHIRENYPGVPLARDFEAALNSDAEGLIIATPISTHYKLAKAALLAGKHVLVEKPLAATAAECRDLIEIADQKGLTLMVGHTFEYHPAVGVVRDIIQQGRIGEIYYANSRRLNLGLYQRDTNVLWDLAPHDLSILFSVLDTSIDTVDAWGCMHVVPHIEDVVYVKLGLASGATAHIHVSWLDPVKVRDFTVVGSEGMIVFDDVQPAEKVKIYDSRVETVFREDSFADFQASYHNGDIFVPEVPRGEPLQLEVHDFANSIITGEPPRTHGRRGLQVVQTLERISECLRAPQAETRPATAGSPGLGMELQLNTRAR